jgi:hypothetical protein
MNIQRRHGSAVTSLFSLRIGWTCNHTSQAHFFHLHQKNVFQKHMNMHSNSTTPAVSFINAHIFLQ